MSDTMSDLLYVDDAAAELRRHPEAVRRLIRSGRLRAARIGRAYVIRREWLDQLVDESTITAA